jgi:hypothetical protein
MLLVASRCKMLARMGSSDATMNGDEIANAPSAVGGS